MQGQKNTRRKRKDHESRDFICLCGRGYLSYAAAYTHVKNKHNLQKKFLDGIGKPEREKLPRGRPRQKKESQASVEIEQLSIIEEAILKIYQCLNNKFEKAILEGNSKKNTADVEKAFDGLVDKKISAGLRSNQITEKFIDDLCKHFNSELSARIRLAVLIISKILSEHNDESVHETRQVVNHLDSFDLWKGQNEINTIIYESYEKWGRLLQQ